MKVDCPSCGVHEQPYTGDPPACMGCGDMLPTERDILPNMDIQFKNKKTGCGTHTLLFMTANHYKRLKDILLLIDVEVVGVVYPYKTKK